MSLSAAMVGRDDRLEEGYGEMEASDHRAYPLDAREVLGDSVAAHGTTIG